MDQLAQRIGIGQAARHRGGRGRGLGRNLAQGDPAIAGETPVGRLERRNAAELPLARHRSVARRRRSRHRETAPAWRRRALPPRRRGRRHDPGRARSIGRSTARAGRHRPRRSLRPARIPSETAPAIPAGASRDARSAVVARRGCDGGARSARPLRSATVRADRPPWDRFGLQAAGGSISSSVRSTGGAAEISGCKVSTKRRVSSSASDSSARHWAGSSVAAASTGADTASLSDAKYSSSPSGRGSAATARAGGGAQPSSTLAASERIAARASATTAFALFDPARATRSTSCRQRTAESWRSPAGWFNTVSRRSSNRTFCPVSSRRTGRWVYAEGRRAKAAALNHPETGQCRRRRATRRTRRYASSLWT